MDVAEQIVVVNEGRVEQAGTPTQVYDEPANPFVMGFIGPVTRLGETWVRPHDLDLYVDGRDGALEAMVERVVRMGFDVRAELALAGGEPLSVQLSRQQADELELERGQILHVRPRRAIDFAA